jgi:hypothetical protein
VPSSSLAESHVHTAAMAAALGGDLGRRNQTEVMF